MPHTKTSICNSALNDLGQPPFVVDADGGAAQEYDAAAAVVEAYDQRFGRVLRSHPWNFATRRIELEADEAAPAFGYARAFSLPADCAKVWALDEGRHGKNPVYKVEGDDGGMKILTDIEAPLHVIYIKRITDPSLFDDEFAEALSAEIASKAALRVLGSKTAARAFRAEAREDQADTRSSDAKENKALPVDEGSWTVGRRTG